MRNAIDWNVDQAKDNIAEARAILRAEALAIIKRQAEAGEGSTFKQKRNARVLVGSLVRLAYKAGIIDDTQEVSLRILFTMALEKDCPLMQGSTILKLAQAEGLYKGAKAEVEDQY